MSYHAISKLLT